MSSIHFETELDAKKLYQTLDNIERELGTMGDAVVREADKMDTTFRRLGGLLATYLSFEGGKQLVSQLINVRGEFQQLDISLQTILGNKAEADQLMAEIVEFAALTPFELSEVGQGAKKLLAFNVEADDTIETLRRLGDVASGLGTDLDGLIQAYGKVKAKGKLQAEEMNLFLERGIPLVSELAEKYGVAESAVYDMASKSQIHFEDLHEVIVKMTDDGGMFANMMEKQAASLPGQVSNLKDAIAQMLNEIGKSNEGVLYGGIGAARTLVENYKEVLVILKAMVVAYGSYKTATIVTSIIQQAQAAGSLVKALKAATVAQKALNLAQKASPWGLAAAAIVTVITAITGLVRITREAKEETEQFKELYDGIGDSVKDSYSAQLTELDLLKKKLEEVKGTREDEQKILETLNKNYSDHLGGLLSETAAYGDMKTAIDEVIASMEKQMEIDILMEKARKVKAESMRLDDTYDQVIDGFQGQAVTGAVERELNKRAQEILKADYGGKVLSGVGSPFEYLKKKLQEDSITYMNEYERIMKEVRALEEESFSTDDLVTVVDYDSSKFTKEIKEAKTAYKEWEEFKTTSRADDLRSEYKQYLDLGATYEEYLVKRLIAVKGNKDASAVVLKELATLEVAAAKEAQKAVEDALEASEKEAKEFRDLYLDIAEDIAEGFVDMMKDMSTKMSETQTKALIATEKEIQEGMDGIEQIAMRYASNKEIFAAQIAELDDNYKKARLPKDEEYYKLRQEITEEYLGNEVSLFMSSATEIFSTLSELTKEYNQELSDVLNELEKVAESASRAVDAYMRGDYLSALLNLFGALVNLQDVIAPVSDNIPYAESEEWRRVLEGVNKEIEISNRLLNEQVDVLEKLTGESWFTGASSAINMIRENMANLLTDMSAFKVWTWQWGVEAADPLGNPWGHFESKPGWSMDDWQTYIDENPDYAFTEDVQNKIDQYNDWVDQMEGLVDDIDQRITGTTSAAITDSIIDGLANGKLYFNDFADSFEDLMKQAIMNSFQTKYLEKQMDEWYDLFVDLSEDGLSNPDVEALRAAYAEAINEASTIWDTMTGSYGDLFDMDTATDTDDPNSLSGAIRRELTEETGTLLAGRMNTIMLDVREGLDIRKDMQTSLNGIEYNTLRMVDHLSEIRYGIITLNDRLS